MKENRKTYNNNVNSERDTTVIQTSKSLGVVSGCKYLNVRSQSDKDSNSVYVLEEGTPVEIDTLNSTDEFYKVSISNGVEGYCMKKFISLA